MAASITVDIDTRKLVAAFARFPGESRSEVRKALGEGAEMLAEGGRKEHRFNRPPHMTSYGRRYTPSGNLDRSIQSEVESEFSSRAYLDLGIAPYARRIHRGFGSWAPDEFMFESVDRNKDRVAQRVEKGLATAIRKAGL